MKRSTVLSLPLLVVRPVLHYSVFLSHKHETSLKKLSQEKHSSLFCLAVGDEENQHYSKTGFLVQIKFFTDYLQQTQTQTLIIN